MPLLDLQKSLRRLGKLRMGETRTSSNGKSFPAKLEHWRITSPSADLIEAVAAVYGGEPHTWNNPAGGGKEWEVYTETTTLRVVVPARKTMREEDEPPEDSGVFSQNHEMWAAGGCQRRCDGYTEQLSGNACMCPADQDERAKAASKGHACKMTTRLSVLLPDIPDIGMWMLESHGYYAAVELGAAYELILPIVGAGRMIPAQLRIEQRTAKRGNETRKYAVPVLELMGVTAGALARGEVPNLTTGEVPARAITNGAPAQISGAEARALEVGSGVAARVPAEPSPRPTAVSVPPQPPLPHEIEGAAGDSLSDPAVPSDVPETVTERGTDQLIAIAAREAGLDDGGRHAFLHAFSGGRYSSSKDVPTSEVNDVRAELVRVKRGESTVWPSQPTLEPAPTVLDVPLPEGNGVWDHDRWMQEIRDVRGVGQSRLLKAARDLASELGVTVPASLNEACDPKLVRRLRDWLREQS